MRAVIAQNHQPVIVDIPKPEFQSHELLVKVHATSLNRADLMQVMGHYPPPEGAPDTLGLELAGEIVEFGSAVDNFKIGQRVMGIVGGGGYAEYATLPAAHAMLIPDNLDFIQAAAIPEAFLTAYSNMVEICSLIAGERVLIHAGASGVGLAAIQIARTLGANVIVTASAGKHAICQQYGADMCIDYKTENFADKILKSDYGGVDVVVEHIGAPYWDDNMRVLNKWGRLVFIGLLGGAKQEVNFGIILQKRLTITGSTLRNRTFERKAGLTGRFWKWAKPHFITGQLKPVIFKTLPFDDVQAAHELMKSNTSAGKLVLTL